MSHEGFFHGKSIAEIVEIRFKEWEMRKAKEKEELEELRKQREQNKADVTAPTASQTAPAHAHPFIEKLKHTFHLD